MSRGAYAGQPMTFRCNVCKTAKSYDDYDRGIHYKTTGRMRNQLSQGMNYRNWGAIAYEYRCLDCNHVGWSRHPDVQRNYRLAYGQNPNEE